MQIQITGGVVIIDDEDFRLVSGHSWYVNESGYAMSRINGRLVRMHRLITEAKSGEQVDHKNRNTLDNRRDNLRVGYQNQNMWNSSKKNRGGTIHTSSRFKGVHKRNGSAGGWYAEVWKFGKKIFTKRFNSEEQAGFAYNIVASREFGEFALLNSISLSKSESEFVLSSVNAFKPRGKNKGGSVYKNKGRWILRMVIDGKMKYISSHKTKDMAEDCLLKMKQSIGGDTRR